jgi:hypothetical protein
MGFLRRGWEAAVAATIGGVLLSLATSQHGVGAADVPVCGNATAPQCFGMCPPGFECEFINASQNGFQVYGGNGNNSCVCQPTGCCEFTGKLVTGTTSAALAYGTDASCQDGVTEAECGPSNDFFPGQICFPGMGCEAPTSTPTFTPTSTPTFTPTSTPTSTPTQTPTVTPTSTGIPDGGDCLDPADCQSGNCVLNVCCETPCNLPGQVCNVVGNEGTCVNVAAPAPAVSRTGLLMIVALLLAVGGFAVWRRRHG